MDILLTPYDGAILGPIAKVIGWIMNGIYVGMSYIGIENVGVSIILLTIVIYMILFPLTYKQQKFSKLSQKMQPEIKAIQEKYKNRKDQASMQAMNQETQLVYQKYGISPMGSCLQLLIQMPILFALYRVFYNVPAYITQVKGSFEGLVNGIIGSTGFDTQMNSIMENFKIAQVTPDWTAKGEALSNYVIDVIYKLPSTAWGAIPSTAGAEEKVNYLINYFPDLGNEISKTAGSIDRFNYFCGLNISDSPWNIIKTSFANGVYWMIVVALLVPILAYVTQMISIKLTPQTNTGDQAAQTMKTMNILMPLMSLFFCFTLPVGLGIYWIMGAVVRGVQQFLLNKHFDKIDLEEIIEKNKEKVEKKKAKQGIARNQINNAAAIRTRTIDAKANLNTASGDEKKFEEAQNIKDNARPGSLAAKANMVKNFNEKNSRK